MDTAGLQGGAYPIRVEACKCSKYSKSTQEKLRSFQYDLFTPWKTMHMPEPNRADIFHVETVYQSNPTSTWRHTGVMPAEAASTDSIEWIANVPAGSIAW